MMDKARAAENDRPAVTGQPIADAEVEKILGDDAPSNGGDRYPADGVSPDRGSSAPRDRPA
jgi:hypothetical protein